MRELRSYGSVRGAISDDRPYRDPRRSNSSSSQDRGVFYPDLCVFEAPNCGAAGDRPDG